MNRRLDARVAAVTAVMTAVVFVLTRLVQIPTPIQGFVHLGDAAIYFTAFAFGPWVGAVAGGLGTALADLNSGFAQWAVFSLLIHGLQGFLAGIVAQRVRGLAGLVLATVTGGVVLVLGYLAAGTILLGFGAAASEMIPNTLQALAGGLIGIPLYLLVLRAYPPLGQWKATRTWTDQ